jgi:ubiquinone/menaquinone biosynthesis C-methylase UbiE
LKNFRNAELLVSTNGFVTRQRRMMYINVKDWYNERAELYHRKWDKIPNMWIDVEEKRFLSELYNLKGKKILVAGGGTGRHAVPLAKNNEVVMIDIAENMMSIAKKVAAEKGVDDNLECIEMNIEDLKFDDRIFDCALATGGVLSYCDNISNALAELSRVLKSGGTITGSVHSKKFQKIQELINKLNRKHKEILTYKSNYFSFNDIKKLTNNNGLRLDRMEGLLFLKQFSYISSFVRNKKMLSTVIFIERNLEKIKFLGDYAIVIYFTVVKQS